MALYLSVPLWLLLSTLGLVAAMLPRMAELWLGRRFGRFALAFGLFKARLAREHIALCLPDIDAAGRQRLLEANFEHLGILFFEFLHFFCLLPGHFRRYSRRNSRMDGARNWEAANAKGKGVVFFSAHLGFWEISAAAAGMAGWAPTIVTTVLKPRWLHDRITACRASTGVQAAFHPGSMPAIMRALRRGGCVAFMNDQYAKPPMGIPAVFFGHKVDTLAVVGALAKRTGAAVLPVFSVRGADGVSRVTIEPELDLGAAADNSAEATQRIAAHVERWVRRHPEQWLWIHRRFKNAIAVGAAEIEKLPPDAAANLQPVPSTT